MTAQTSAHADEQTDPVYMTAPQVLARFQITDMTLWRWLQDEKLGFPRPLVINRRRLFLKSALVEWERTRAGQLA
ncbi:helix-turn-helix domain-containing protein [Mesorhizobium sp. M1060]|uniref:helix-turn-helix transcriptional regulator n=1 Tax=unclassified Mesorhizobium TaxID=325217 RepID=UPI0033381C47